MINAPSSLESVVPIEFRSHGPILVPSGLVSNVTSFVTIGHDSRSLSKIIIPNILPSVTQSEFPIFHVSAISSVSPSYIPLNVIITASITLPSDKLSSRPSLIESEEPVTDQIIDPTESRLDIVSDSIREYCSISPRIFVI